MVTASYISRLSQAVEQIEKRLKQNRSWKVVTVRRGYEGHPHILRHACGFALANKGHDTRALRAYLGHRNIQHTVRYTELSPGRFKDFWR